MDRKQSIIDRLIDLSVRFFLFFIGIAIDFIGKRYNNYIEKKKTNSPEFSEKYDKTKNKIQKTTITTFEIIYRILSYISLTFVAFLSILSIASGINGIIQHEEIEASIAEIVIGLIIGRCGYLFIKGNKHEYEYESSDVKKEKIKKMVDNMFEEDSEESEKLKNKKKSSKK